MKFSVREKQNMTGWAFLTPAVILIFLMNFIPIIKGNSDVFPNRKDREYEICRIYKLCKDSGRQQM